MKLSKLGVVSASTLVCLLIIGLKAWDSRASAAPVEHVVLNQRVPAAEKQSTTDTIDQALSRRKQRLAQIAQARRDIPGATQEVDWEKYEATLEDEEFDDRDPVEQVKEEVALLERQHPMKFMQAFASSPGGAQMDKAVLADAEHHVARYVEARTTLLKKMYVDYVADPFYDPDRDVTALLELDQTYEHDISHLVENLPGIADIPQVFRETALPPPFFAKEAWDELHPPTPSEIVDLRQGEARETQGMQEMQ